jgi:transposase
MVDVVLSQLSRSFDRMYAKVGRPSIAPEKLLRAQLLQIGPTSFPTIIL